MARVVYDYPELRSNIGDMRVSNPETGAMMSTQGAAGGTYKIDFKYNANYDRQGTAAEKTRQNDIKLSRRGKHYNAPNYDYAGTHEMGHGLISLLPDAENLGARLEETNNAVHEDDILKTVIGNTNVLTEEQKKNIKYHNKDKRIKKDVSVLKGQIDTEGSKFFENGLTSLYGATNLHELFAESFHDIYANGKEAKPLSKEIVKEYERRQRKLTEKRFKKNAKRGFFRRFIDFFKF